MEIFLINVKKSLFVPESLVSAAYATGVGVSKIGKIKFLKFLEEPISEKKFKFWLSGSKFASLFLNFKYYKWIFKL